MEYCCRWLNLRWLLIVAACLLGGELSKAHASLVDYVRKADDSFEWKLVSTTPTNQGTLYTLTMVSQTWQGIRWEHKIRVFVPANTKPGARMLLYVTGNFNPLDMAQGFALAERMQAPCAILYDVPNQPLFNGKSEDSLIAESFVRFLETGDSDWPLLFPMVKSVIRAMDALQAFCMEQFQVQVQSFIVAGASKRGWTTWLTAATGEPRVRAIAPMVIDVLNMPAQMKHQLDSFGRFSEMIVDYTRRKLVPIPDTPRAKQLWQMVDPFIYREKITQPTLIILGANDPYWTVDATQFYWDELKSKDRWISMIPNAGHDLGERTANGKRNFDRALSVLATFARSYIDEEPLPKISWKFDDSGREAVYTVTTSQRPSAVRLWTTEAMTKNFSRSKWEDRVQPVERADGPIRVSISRPEQGFKALFVELEFRNGREQLYRLTTQAKVIEPAKQ